MPLDIIVPRLGWSMEEGAFVAWLKKDGELVRAGEPLFSIEGDKAVQEIESIDSGILRIAANGPKPGDPIRVGDVLGYLMSEGDPTPTATSSRATGAVASLEAAAPSPVADAPFVARQVQSAGSLPRSPAISPRALRVATELGVNWTTVTGTGRLGRIRERDIRAAVTVSPPPLARAAPGSKPVVLVTGGCGFIGTWVVRELLERGLRAVVFDPGNRPARWERVIGEASAGLPLIHGDLLDRALLDRVFDEYPIANIIHLAALLTPDCQADPWEGCRVNVLGSLALFEQARRRGGRINGFSYASSVAVFGDSSDARAASGDGHGPPTFYGAFKKSVELFAEQYWRHFKIASLGIRPQVAYGPERETGLTAGPSLAARAAARGESFCIGYTGRVGYDYVEDVARALVRGALETPPGAHVVDLAGEMADVNQVIAAIAGAVPEAAVKLTADGPAIPAHERMNPYFISTLYRDWETTSLAEGARRTVEFYRLPKE